MKKVILVISITILAIALIGCTRFKYPTGKWECAELKIILDFDCEIGKLKTEEGEILAIVFGINPIGNANIYMAIEKEDGSYDYGDRLYNGVLFNKGKNKMTFKCSTRRSEAISEIYNDKEYIKFEFVKIVE